MLLTFTSPAEAGTVAGIVACIAILLILLGFVTGRVSAPEPRGPLYRFKLSNAQLALIAYEASRAYKIAHGDLSAKSFNNLPRSLRNALVAKVAAFRSNTYGIPDAAPAELHLQAAIVALAV